MATVKQVFNLIKRKFSEGAKDVKRTGEDALNGKPGLLKQVKRGSKDLKDNAQYFRNSVGEAAKGVAQDAGLIKKPWYKEAWDAVVQFIREIFGDSSSYEVASEEKEPKPKHKYSPGYNAIKAQYQRSKSDGELNKQQGEGSTQGLFGASKGLAASAESLGSDIINTDKGGKKPEGKKSQMGQIEDSAGKFNSTASKPRFAQNLMDRITGDNKGEGHSP